MSKALLYPRRPKNFCARDPPNELRTPNGPRPVLGPILVIPEPQGPKIIHSTLVRFTRMLWLPKEGSYILPHNEEVKTLSHSMWIDQSAKKMLSNSRPGARPSTQPVTSMPDPPSK